MILEIKKQYDLGKDLEAHYLTKFNIESGEFEYRVGKIDKMDETINEEPKIFKIEDIEYFYLELITDKSHTKQKAIKSNVGTTSDIEAVNITIYKLYYVIDNTFYLLNEVHTNKFHEIYKSIIPIVKETKKKLYIKNDKFYYFASENRKCREAGEKFDPDKLLKYTTFYCRDYENIEHTHQDFLKNSKEEITLLENSEMDVKVVEGNEVNIEFQRSFFHSRFFQSSLWKFYYYGTFLLALIPAILAFIYNPMQDRVAAFAISFGIFVVTGIALYVIFVQIRLQRKKIKGTMKFTPDKFEYKEFYKDKTFEQTENINEILAIFKNQYEMITFLTENKTFAYHFRQDRIKYIVNAIEYALTKI